MITFAVVCLLLAQVGALVVLLHQVQKARQRREATEGELLDIYFSGFLSGGISTLLGSGCPRPIARALANQVTTATMRDPLVRQTVIDAVAQMAADGTELDVDMRVGW